MFRSRLFWKLIAVYALLSAVTTICGVILISSRLRLIAYDQVRQRLHDSAITALNLLDDPFSGPPSPRRVESIRAIAEANGTRITLIGSDGVVTVDTEQDPKTMENHGQRPEVREALAKGTGTAQRTSPTLGIPMVYVAIRYGAIDSPEGYVRVAMPVDGIEAEVISLQGLVIIPPVVLSIIALAPIFVILPRVIRPLASLTTAANAIAEGDLQQTVHADRSDELGKLANAFNSMSRELATRMSDLNRTSQELRESSELLETVLGSMVEGVLAVDNDDRILFANRAARAMLDLRDRDLAGRAVWENVRNETVQSVVKKAMHSRVNSVECQLPRSETIVQIQATALAGDPPPGVVLVFHDVTELRRLENMRREFVSNVSHELKTPLTIIQTATETLLDGALASPEHAPKFLARIDEQGKRLYELIVDLLDLAKIESGEQVFELVAVSVGDIVASLFDEFSALGAAKGVTLLLEPADDELHVESDRMALRTIMANLLSNAVKYTPSGGTVTVIWRSDGAYGLIQVKDTGVGISREHQPRIFERFYRVDRARTREVGGTGLGLSIVKHLASVFSAQVFVESELGSGSTFSVRIPMSGEANDSGTLTVN